MALWLTLVLAGVLVLLWLAHLWSRHFSYRKDSTFDNYMANGFRFSIISLLLGPGLIAAGTVWSESAHPTRIVLLCIGAGVLAIWAVSVFVIPLIWGR